MRYRTMSVCLAAAIAVATLSAAARGQAVDRAKRGAEGIMSFATNPDWPPWAQSSLSGKNFTIAMIDNLPDLHGDVIDPQLVVFFAGNQFMVVPDLIKAFQEEHPDIQRIYVETLPPGILVDQMEQGALVIGNLRIAISEPDVFTAGHGRISRLQQEKGWFDEIRQYANNRLAIMVPKGNPANIHSLRDLGAEGVRVSMPNPKWEGIGGRIVEAYHKAGGKDLADRIMDTKVATGTTFLTHIHHRQTPLRILTGLSDAGPVWYTEAHFQVMLGKPIETVTIPDKDNVIATYTAATMKKAPHPKAAKAFLDFLGSKKGFAVYEKYGFLKAP